MNVRERIKQLGLRPGETDTALPLSFYNGAKEFGRPNGHIVWSYRGARLGGVPCALDETGSRIIRRFNARYGTRYDPTIPNQ